MSLRSQQVTELQTMYLNGASIEHIAEALHVSKAIVKDFLPTGDLAVAYDNVITCGRELQSAEELSGEARENAVALDNDYGRLSAALRESDDTIKQLTATIRKLKASRKSLSARLKEVDEIASEVDKITSAYESHECEVRTEYNDALAGKLRVEAEYKEADKQKRALLARAAKAEKLAEQVIIDSAIAAAKDLVQQSVNIRLDREAQDGGC